MNTFKELVMANRSRRGFDENRKVERGELETLVDYTRYCAASANIQPLKYYLSCDQETNSKIQPLTGWAKRIEEELPHEGEKPTAFIVVCVDKNIGANPAAFSSDVGIVAQTILLGAVEMGLGGCMIGNFKRGELGEALKLESNIEPELVIAIGKPIDDVVITDIDERGDTCYHRENNVHYVPKRKLEDIII